MTDITTAVLVPYSLLLFFIVILGIFFINMSFKVKQLAELVHTYNQRYNKNLLNIHKEYNNMYKIIHMLLLEMIKTGKFETSFTDPSIASPEVGTINNLDNIELPFQLVKQLEQLFEDAIKKYELQKTDLSES